jgi:uncharacterized protein
MRLVVDTNVFVSGVFFGGPPYAILEAWRRRKVELVVSLPILAEYRATGDELAGRFPGADLDPWIRLVEARASLVEAPALGRQVCTDPDDDKFLACALAGRARMVITGDRALLRVTGYSGVTVTTPRLFVDEYLG